MNLAPTPVPALKAPILIARSELLEFLAALTSPPYPVITVEHLTLIERMLSEVTAFLAMHMETIQKLRENMQVAKSIDEQATRFIGYRQNLRDVMQNAGAMDDQIQLQTGLKSITQDYIILRELLLGTTLVIDV